MQMNSYSPLASRGVTFLLAALVAASGVYWVLKWPVEATLSGVTALTANEPSEPESMALLLGLGRVSQSPITPASLAPSRMILIGVVAGASGGTALIAVDGKPAKPIRVGGRVEEGLILQSVAKRQAVLAASINGPALMKLELSALSK